MSSAETRYALRPSFDDTPEKVIGTCRKCHKDVTESTLSPNATKDRPYHYGCHPEDPVQSTPFEERDIY